MEIRYDLTGLTFGEVMELMVANETRAVTLADLMEALLKEQTDTAMAAREVMRQQLVRCYGLRDKLASVPPRPADGF